MSRNTGTSEFKPCPEGQWPAVLADIVDLGYIETFFEGKSQGLKAHVQFVWQCHTADEDGVVETQLLFDRRFKWSFDPKANLYKRLCDWQGQAKIDAMLDEGAEIESLLGLPAYINVVHNESNGNVYANVGSIMPLPKGLPIPKVIDYTRRCERDDWTQKAPAYSAFEFLPEGIVAGADGRPIAAEDMHPNTRQANAINQKANAINQKAAAAAFPAPRPMAHHEPPTDPMKPATMAKLIGIATQKWGPIKALAELNAWLGRDVATLTNDEAIAKKDELIAYNPVASDDDSEYSPFADEGEPGWRPEGHPDRVAFENENRQPELVGTVPATANTAHK